MLGTLSHPNRRTETYILKSSAAISDAVDGHMQCKHILFEILAYITFYILVMVMGRNCSYAALPLRNIAFYQVHSTLLLVLVTYILMQQSANIRQPGQPWHAEISTLWPHMHTKYSNKQDVLLI